MDEGIHHHPATLERCRNQLTSSPSTRLKGLFRGVFRSLYESRAKDGVRACKFLGRWRTETGTVRRVSRGETESCSKEQPPSLLLPTTRASCPGMMLIRSVSLCHLDAEEGDFRVASESLEPVRPLMRGDLKDHHSSHPRLGRKVATTGGVLLFEPVFRCG